MSKPNKSRIRKWVAALRSGKYDQTRGQLRFRASNKFCCLGVMCDLYKRETGKGRWRLGYFNSDHAAPPFSVQKWFGMLHYGELSQLAHMNDRGASFTAIADYIERNYLK